MKICNFHFFFAAQHFKQIFVAVFWVIGSDLFTEFIDVDFAIVRDSIEKRHLHDFRQSLGSKLLTLLSIG